MFFKPNLCKVLEHLEEQSAHLFGVSWVVGESEELSAEISEYTEQRARVYSGKST